MLSHLSAEEQKRPIDEHFDRAVGEADDDEEGLRLEGFLEWHKTLRGEAGGTPAAVLAPAPADMEC